MQIKVKKLSETAIVPTRADAGSAGWDLYADAPAQIPANGTVFIDTGIAVEIPEGYWGGIYARSGLACKCGLRPANCVGVIDSSYRGAVKVALHNDNDMFIWQNIHNSNTTFGQRIVQDYDANKSISRGDRIAQLIIHKCENVEFIETDELSDSERGAGGFGSSGT